MEILFNGWSVLLRTLVVGVLAYAGLVLLLNVSGKRTLSKMNAFDFVVTIALGSTLASTLVSSSVSLAQGVLAFAVLIGLQYVITWLSVRSRAVSQLVKAEPTLLVHQGRFLRGAMDRERVTESEILQALREQGMISPEKVEAVVLETNGGFSVIGRKEDASPVALSNVGSHDARRDDGSRHDSREDSAA